jgi:enolase
MEVNRNLKSIRTRTVLSSRGHPTVEVELNTTKGRFISSCPSGVSTGAREAKVRTDGGARYGGRGVDVVLEGIKDRIDVGLLDCSMSDQARIDEFLIAADGTRDKSGIGANGILPLSTAFCKAGASFLNKELYEFIAELGSFFPAIPRPHFNILNGGAHSGNGLAVQEIMVAYQHDAIGDNIEAACVLYETLKGVIAEKYGSIHTGVGDEGGFVPPIKTLREGLELILTSADRCGRKNFRIALDVAANEILKDGRYSIDGSRYTTGELGEFYVGLLGEFPQIYILEDPFAEDDHEGWMWLSKKVGDRVEIVGDDLTVTNTELIEKAGNMRMCNVLLVKPNQIGTVAETIDAVKAARRHGMKIMVSHRSGETEDCFIADLAVGVGAEYIKAGAPCRGERTCKYNQLLRIAEEIKH